jgi:hypothetical protein
MSHNGHIVVFFDVAVFCIFCNVLVGYEEVPFQYPVVELKPMGEEREIVRMIKQTHFHSYFLLLVKSFILKFELDQQMAKSVIFSHSLCLDC